MKFRQGKTTDHDLEAQLDARATILQLMWHQCLELSEDFSSNPQVL